MRRHGFTWIELLAAVSISVLASIIVVPVLRKFFVPHVIVCPKAGHISDIKQLTLGVIMYSGDYDDLTPLPHNWLYETAPYVKNTEVLHCQGLPNARANDHFGHAMHTAMPQRTWTSIASPATEVFLLDSADLWPNAVSDITRLPKAGREKGQNAVSYADGHTKSIKPGATP